MPKVLLVDDEEDILLLLRRILNKHGFTTVEASSAKEALQKAGEDKPDAVVLDIMMPKMDGWEVSRKIKTDHDTSEVPIIMLSVLAEDRDKVKSFDYAGADWHISTPFDTDHLLFILDAAVKKERGQELGDDIKDAIARDRRMRKVLDMINPKLLNRDYSFLNPLDK
jgi:DNA-binding response OmpR family regulator